MRPEEAAKIQRMRDQFEAELEERIYKMENWTRIEAFRMPVEEFQANPLAAPDKIQKFNNKLIEMREWVKDNTHGKSLEDLFEQMGNLVYYFEDANEAMRFKLTFVGTM